MHSRKAFSARLQVVAVLLLFAAGAVQAYDAPWFCSAIDWFPAADFDHNHPTDTDLPDDRRRSLLEVPEVTVNTAVSSINGSPTGSLRGSRGLGFPAGTSHSSGAAPTFQREAPEESAQRSLLDQGDEDLGTKLDNLVKGWVNQQGGSPTVDEIDYGGTNDWFKQNFLSLRPFKIRQGMSAPVVTPNTTTAESVRQSTVLCPWRNFTYGCRLDANAFKSTITATTHTSAWNRGCTDKAGVIAGVDAQGNGLLAGVTASLQFQYTETDARMEASTDQFTMVASTDVTITAKDNQCVRLTTILDKIKAEGKIVIYAVFDGWLGVYQKDRRHWTTDRSPTDTHHYRAVYFPFLVQTAKAAGLQAANGFYIRNGKPELTMTYNLNFDMATRGYNIQDRYDKDSEECTGAVPHTASTSSASVAGTAKVAVMEDLAARQQLLEAVGPDGYPVYSAVVIDG